VRPSRLCGRRHRAGATGWCTHAASAGAALRKLDPTGASAIASTSRTALRMRRPPSSACWKAAISARHWCASRRRRDLAQSMVAVPSILKQCDGAQAAVRAYADNGAAPRRHRGKLLHGLAQDTRAGGREGMAKGNAAPIGVHAIAREASEGMFDAGLLANVRFILQGPDVAGHLRRKRLMNLPKRDVVERQPAPPQQPRYGGDGCHEQSFVEDIDRGHLEIDESHPWRRAR